MKKIIKSSELHSTDLAESRAPAHSVMPTAMTGDGRGVVSRGVLDAKTQAEAILHAAQIQSETMRSHNETMRADIEHAREQAKREGFAAGREAGLAEATEFAMRLQLLKEKFYDHADEEMRTLIMLIAEKVLGRLASEHRDVIVAIVRQAIDAAIGDRMTVRVSPTDYAVLMQEDSALRAGLDKTKRLHFKEDDTIAPGGCVVDTEVGTIDAQLETQLQAIRKALEI